MTAGIHPGLGEIGRIAPESSPKEPVKETSAEPSDLDKALARAEEAEAREREANTALQEATRRTPSPTPLKTPVEQAPPKPGKMPDPNNDPEGFEKWTQTTREYDNYMNRQHTIQVRDAAVALNRSDEIVNAYVAAHPNYTPLRSHVYQCFRDAATELRLAELPDDTTTLDAVVDGKMKTLIKAAAEATGKSTDTERETDEEAAQRTGGLSAGSEGPTAGGATPKEEDGIPIKPLRDVLRDRQAKSGLF